MVVFNLVLYLVAGLVFLAYLGYGPARLLVLGEAARDRLLWLAPVGLCVLIVCASFLNTLLPMAAVVWVLLALATALNVWLVRKTGDIGLARPSGPQWGVLALTVGAYVLGVLPLIHAGSTAFLGIQWDLEIYLPLTEYLKRFPLGGELHTYPNPLVETVNSAPVRGGSGWGFSYFDAALGSLLGWRADESFRPGLHLVFALSVPAVYLFCRWGLGLGATAGLLAAGLAGANGLNQWMAGIGLAGHAVTFMTLPLGLLSLQQALEQRTRAACLLAGLVLGAMLLAFYTGALALFVIAGGSLALLLLWRSVDRTRMLLMGGTVAVAALALGLVAHLRFLALIPLYSRFGFTEGWHVEEFPTISQALGLAPFSLVSERLKPDVYWEALPTPILVGWTSGLALGALALTLLALVHGGWRRDVFLALALGWIAFGFFLRVAMDYPYGYLKLLSLASFLLLAGLSQGLVTLWHLRWSAPRAALAGRTMAAGYALLFLPLLVSGATQSLRFFWEPDPHELPRAVWELQQMRAQLLPGAPVYLTGRSSFEPRMAAMVAYFLIENPVAGNLKTAYGQVKSPRPDEPYQYLLFQAGERPEERGLQQQDLLWRNELVALYRRPQGWLASIDLESVEQPLQVSASAPLSLNVGGNAWALESKDANHNGALAGSSSTPQVELTLLALQETTTLVSSGRQQQRVSLPAGLLQYYPPPLDASGRLELALPADSQPVWLLGLRVLQDDTANPRVQASSDTLLLQPRLTLDAGRAAVQVDYHLSETRGGYAAFALELYRRTGYNRAPAGFWQIGQAKPGDSGRMAAFLDLSSLQCSQTAVQAVGATAAADGNYELHLAGYYVNEEVVRLPWLSFSVSNGKIAALKEEPQQAYGVRYLKLPREVQALALALPSGALVYTPPRVDPDRSFIPVAVRALPDRNFYTDDPALLLGARHGYPGAAYPYGLFAPDEPPDRWGFDNARSIWSNDQASLYHRGEAAPAAGRPASRSVPATAEPATELLRAAATLYGQVVQVTVEHQGSPPPGSALGLDIYQMGSCEPVHYGWWATPLGTGFSQLTFTLDLVQQEGRITGRAAAPLPVDSQRWAAPEGGYRAFVLIKQGEEFQTVPIFEFGLFGGKVRNFHPYPVRQTGALAVRPLAAPDVTTKQP